MSAKHSNIYLEVFATMKAKTFWYDPHRKLSLDEAQLITRAATHYCTEAGFAIYASDEEASETTQERP